MFAFLNIFNFYRRVYGGAGVPMAISRFVLFILSLVIIFSTRPDLHSPMLKRIDPVELMGLIVGSLTALYAILGLVPGSRISRVHRLFEAGVVLCIAYFILLLSLRMTKGEMPAKYVGPGLNRASRVWSAFIAAAIAGPILVFTTAIDFMRRNGPPGEEYYDDKPGDRV